MTKLILTDAEKPLWMMARCAAFSMGEDARPVGTRLSDWADAEADAAIEALRERVEGGV